MYNLHSATSGYSHPAVLPSGQFESYDETLFVSFLTFLM